MHAHPCPTPNGLAIGLVPASFFAFDNIFVPFPLSEVEINALGLRKGG